ncbi:AraC family transcriptional regulator [Paenibacillus solisilvae]|uniref:AraC family transcriptional regulator n=1 Tax=Paenibacillus solisilvae TaxID=2486751 RepID=A0ABW0W3M4_9BACL
MQELFLFEADIPFHLFDYSPPERYAEQHWHSFYEIGYCYAGTGSFHIADRTYPVQPGDLMLFPPYEPHIAQSDPAQECRFYFVYFSDAFFQEEDRQLLMSFRNTAIRNLHVEIPPLGAMFAAMLDEYTSKRSGFAALLRSRMLELCVRLHRMDESAHTESSWSGMLKSLSQIKPALEFIHTSYREQIGLKELADVLSLSESRARHLFKEAVGKNFKEYLAFVRIQEAKRLLCASDPSVTDIYLACGFHSSAPFYRSFQQLVGISPLGYRRLHRKE